MRGVEIERVSWDQDGLVPAVVQDRLTRRVLMLGYMDREAFNATIESGLVHFHSRSRNSLWQKGETSGNSLRLTDISIDCDGDSLLVVVDPAGPTCHTGATSCWDTEAEQPEAGFADLEVLWRTIQQRSDERPDGSYTTALLDDPDLAVRKITEEATEVLMAARDHRRGEASDERLAEEMADLVYHLLVVCAERAVSPTEFLIELRRRRR